MRGNKARRGKFWQLFCIELADLPALLTSPLLMEALTCRDGHHLKGCVCKTCGQEFHCYTADGVCANCGAQCHHEFKEVSQIGSDTWMLAVVDRCQICGKTQER